MFGEYPEQQLIEARPLLTGRHMNSRDIEDKRKIAVIGERVRDILFAADEEAIGGSIRINGVNFTVVGVFTSMRSGEDAEEDLQSIRIPFTAFNQAFHKGDDVGWLCVLFDEQVNADSAAAEIMSVLKARLSIHPEDNRAVGHWTGAREFEEIQSVFSAIRWVSFVFGGLALLAGIIGIMNIMLITVRERTNELGIRRALGATLRRGAANHGRDLDPNRPFRAAGPSWAWPPSRGLTRCWRPCPTCKGAVSVIQKYR